MKARGVSILAILVLAAAPSFAGDYGLALSNDSAFAADSSASLTQVNRARAWGSLPLGENGSVYLSGFYEFRGTFGGDNPQLVPLRLDVDRSEVEGSVTGIAGSASVLRYSIGRNSFLDFSSRVISGLSDGLRAELSIGNMSFQALVGYRGLLYKADALSLVDDADSAVNAKDGVYFAPSRAVAGLRARFIELLSGQDLGIEALAQIDLTGSAKPTHTQYLEPFVEGRFGRLLRWRAWDVVELGYDGSFFASMAAGEQLRLSMPDYLGLRVTQSFAWASGASGPFRAFTPIRQGTIGSVSAFYFTDALSLSLDADLSPLRGLSVGTTAAAIFRASDNPPQASGATTRTDATGRLLGIEALLRASYSLRSDVALSGNAGLFVPNTTTLYTSDTPNRWTASFSANCSL